MAGYQKEFFCNSTRHNETGYATYLYVKKLNAVHLLTEKICFVQ